MKRSPAIFVRTPKQLARTRRCGYSMIEVLAAIAVLTSLMAVWLPMQHTARKLQRAHQRRQVALFEAAGALERLAAWPAAELTPERAETFDLSEAGRHALPDAQLHVHLHPADDQEAQALRVAVRVSWRESPAERGLRQVELVTWRYAPLDGGER